MRILLASGSFWPTIGGVETHVRQLAERLAEAGHEVSVVAAQFMSELALEDRLGDIPVHRSRAAQTSLGKIFSYTSTFRRVADAFGPDVIHSHMVLPAALAPALIARRTPLVVTVHGDDVATFPEMDWGHRLKPANRWATDFALRNASTVIAVCEWLAACVRPIVPAERVCVVYNGIDVTAVEAPPPPGDLVVATRRFHRKNGMRFLVEAASRLSNIPFVLAGDGPEFEALRAGATDNVTFAGALTPDAVASLYEQARFTVMPSLAETMPYSGLESMLHGRAVVGTTVGGIPELIQDGSNGVLVPPADADALANAIGDLYSDRERAGAMGRAGRDLIMRRHAWPGVLPQILDVYAAAVAGGPAV